MTTITHPENFLDNGDIEGLIAFHRQTFGGFFMETVDEGKSSDETPPEGDESASEEEGEGESTDEGEESSDGDENASGENDDDLPDWARTKLTKANAEAANYRTRLRKAEEDLANAKTPEQVEELLTQFKAEREEDERVQAEEKANLVRENVALKFKLPKELADALKGATREELEAHAEVLKKFAPDDDDEPDSLSGGLTPGGGDPEGNDPRTLAKKYGPRRAR